MKKLHVIDAVLGKGKQGASAERHGWQIQCARHAAFAAVLDRGRGVLLNASGGMPLRTSEAVTKEIPRLAVLSDNGRWISAASEQFDGKGFQSDVELWDTESGKPMLNFRVPDAITSMAISSEGKWLATGHPLLGGIRLWKTYDGTEAAAFTGHEANVMSLVFSSGDNWLFSGSMDCTIFDMASAPMNLQCEAMRPSRHSSVRNVIVDKPVLL